MPYIDAFTHFFPQNIYEAMFLNSEIPDIGKRMRDLAAISDIDTRLRILDNFSDYRQVICLGMPPIEAVAGPENTPALARIANDGLSELVRTRPDYFYGYAAALPMNAPDAAAREVARVAADPGCIGLQIHTNINGLPLDDPRFAPIFAAAAAEEMTILLHPNRTADFSDYPEESFSRYEIWQVLGWPYETSVAMARLVLSGMMDRFEGIKILTHHLGGMIPYFEGRVGWKSLGTRSSREDYSDVLAGLKKAPIEYFRAFYGDTAMTLTPGAFTCGKDFFGTRNIIFATDCPFPNGGTDRMQNIVSTIESMPLTRQEKDLIFHDNAVALFDRPGRR